MSEIKSGFVNLIGLSNVGKSTFVNEVVGDKVSIVSEKPQTTRNRIRCIYNDQKSQIVFLDTPGIHRPEGKLGKKLLHRARKSLKGANLILYMTEPKKDSLPPEEKSVLKKLKEIDIPKLFLLNKIDIYSPEDIAAALDIFSEGDIFKEYIPISALKRTNLDIVLEKTIDLLPHGERLFPRDMNTDEPLEFLVSLFVREKIYKLTYREVPYSVAVKTKSIEERSREELIEVYADIYVVRSSQKGILIGEGGEMIKRIGKEARKDIEELLDCKVYLDLEVKVRKNWNRDEGEISSLLASEGED